MVAGLLLLAVGFLPLFGGPGYEHALAAGLVLPSAAAIATALDAVRSERREIAPIALIGRGVASGFALGGDRLCDSAAPWAEGRLLRLRPAGREATF